MNLHATAPRFEFRVFGQQFSRAVASVVANFPAEAADEGLQTYLLSAAEHDYDVGYNVKLRKGKLAAKLLIREHLGLERWQPYLQLPFPLTAAFCHEFVFAWLAVEPPPLRRDQYTEPQFLQEIVLPHPQLCAVQLYKQRRQFTVNGCKLELASLCINQRHQIKTVAVEAAEADNLLHTVELLHLHTFENTNYIVGLRELLGKEALPHRQRTAPLETFATTARPEYALVR
ncbi:MAG: hypothetical protein KF832_08110 [Caldilineaceae bacterium]|nr:hypothetical protein [Caldilineaceae bacterium]